MTARVERVLLHAGPPKSGSTSLQSFFRKNREALAKQGVLIPQAGWSGGQHMDLPLIVAQRERKGVKRLRPQRAATDNLREKFATRLQSELSDGQRYHTLLFSSEAMFLSKDEEVVGYRELFSKYASRLEVILYLRRQDEWLASHLLQKRKTGAKDLELHPGTVDRYWGSLRAWHGHANRCYMRRLQPGALYESDLIRDFCHASGFKTDGLEVDIPRRNEAILQEQFALVDALNSAISSMSPAQQMKFRAPFIAFSAEFLGGSRVEFSRASAEQTFQAYAEPNAWLRENYDPKGEEFFFSLDFSKYPETPQNDRTYSVQQLFRLLKAVADKCEALGAAPKVPVAGDRDALIESIVASFIRLRRAELKLSNRKPQAKKRRRSLAFQARAATEDYS